MLEYFKRPWSIQGHVEGAMRCNASHHLELLVNVDSPGNPEHHAGWAAAAVNSSGLVSAIAGRTFGYGQGRTVYQY